MRCPNAKATLNQSMARVACAVACAALVAAITGCSSSPPVARAVAAHDGSPDAALFAEIAALDAGVFAAFNACDVAEHLQRHASYFADDVEFYHDRGGVTWTRDAMLENTARFACGKYRRELIAGSLRVYPVKAFGAIALGKHRFCQIADGKCDGAADFVMVWRKRDHRWMITRVLSYGHRPI